MDAWPVRSLMHVVAVGRGNFEIPFMNGGRLLSGGFVRARCMQVGGMALPSSVRYVLLVLCRIAGPSMEVAWRATSAAMVLKHRKGVDHREISLQGVQIESPSMKQVME